MVLSSCAQTSLSITSSPSPHPSLPAVVDFYNRVNLIYGTLAEFCTPESCPRMSGGPMFEYYWKDEGKYKKPTALPAATVGDVCGAGEGFVNLHMIPLFA